MFETTPIHPVHDVFGAGYVPEQHCDLDHRNLPPRQSRDLREDFNEILKSLRSALGIKRQ
jgi:hypothetical protein